MKIAQECPICGGSSSKSYYVNIAPFIRERMFQFNVPESCLFVHCTRCDFYYYSIRPDECEMEIFYSGYRNEKYQLQRHKHEPNYTADYNAMIGNHPVEIHNRITHLENVLRRNAVVDSIDILDFGGNDGRFIPPSISGHKYCYDLSDNNTIEGVIKLYQADLPKHRYDLILLSHILEHVSSPNELMNQVVSLMNEGNMLYIELPYERELIEEVFPRNTSLAMSLKGLLKHYRPTWIFPSVSFALGGSFCHEHINSFTEKSLEKVISNSGLTCIEIGTKRMSLGWLETDILYCLAKLENA